MKQLTLKQVALSTILVSVIGFVLAMTLSHIALGATGNLSIAQSALSDQYRTYEFFASTTDNSVTATTTTATSTNITPFYDSNGKYDDGSFDVRGAKKVSVFFSRDAGTGKNDGSSLFTVQVTKDGTNWVNYNKLISNVSNTNAQTLTRVASVSISAATSTVMVGVDVQNDSFKAIRCVVTETTDGSHSCSASATY
jgi:hypothetical protein